ncbi:MAG: hypothetical protein Q8M07_14640, partial [Prosthecobacter sp.]|nr:hypothetical protein [Prosthecobacter sp.]
VFAAIAAVSLSLIVGVTFSTLSFIREKAARQRAEFAERETEAALRKEAAQRLAAQIQAEAAISKNVAAAKPIEALARAFWAVARSAEAGHSVPPVPVNSLVNALLHARQRWVAATPLVTALAVDAEHTLCAVGCAAGDLEIHEMATGKRLQRKGVAHRGDTIAVAFFPDGQSLATGGEDGFIRLWTHRLDPVHEGWLAHPGWVKALAVSADGLHLLSIGGEGALKCWDATQPGKLLWTHQLPCGQVTAANFDRMGGKVIVQSANLFDLAAYVATCGSPDGTVQRLVFGDSPLSAIALSADGTRAALGTSEGTVQLWRTADAIRLGTFQTCNSKITALAFHDDNQALSSMADDHLWRVFSLDGKEMQPPAPGGSTPLAFFGGISPGLLHTNRQGGNVILKDVGDLLAAPSFNVGADLKGIVWSPDGRLIASVDGARQLNVWEAANGQPLGQTRCSAAGIFPKIAASPDGSLLATISNGESLVRFWTWEGQPAAEVPQITLPNGCGAGLIWHPQRQELWVGTTTGHLYSLSHTAGSQARLLHSLNIPGGGLGIASLTLVGEHIVTLWGCSGDGERQVRSKAWLTAFALDGRLAVEEPLNTERILDSWGTYTIIAPIGAPGEFLEASQLQNDALVVRRHRLGATDITELSSFRMFAQTDKGYWSATPRGSLVAAVTSSRGISLLDISGVAITPPFLLGRKGIGTPSFDPAGKRIAVGGRTGWIYICHAGLAAWTKLAVDKLRSDMSWQQEALDAAVKTDLQRLLANPPAMHGIPISP